MAADKEKVFGVLAQFGSSAEIFHACEKVRDAGYTKWDSYTPFPVHNLDKAMGLPPSRIPWIVFVMGMIGAGGAMTLQWWINAVEYPIVYAAKPYFSWQAFIPVTFELGVLFAALTSFIAMLHFNRLPRFHHPLFASKRFERATDDGFFIAIEAEDSKFDPEKTSQFLKDIGGTNLEMVKD